jgi:hypothetical protein
MTSITITTVQSRDLQLCLSLYCNLAFGIDAFGGLYLHWRLVELLRLLNFSDAMLFRRMQKWHIFFILFIAKRIKH